MPLLTPCLRPLQIKGMSGWSEVRHTNIPPSQRVGSPPAGSGATPVGVNDDEAQSWVSAALSHQDGPMTTGADSVTRPTIPRDQGFPGAGPESRVTVCSRLPGGVVV